MTPAVSASGLSVDLVNTPILVGVDLELDHGEAVGLTGANGSGKSTLLRCLATLQRPTGGSLSILGADAGSPDRRAVRPQITYVGHDSGFYPQLSLLENLLLVARLLGREEAAATESLAAVGLRKAANRALASSSKGMVRRAELARVLLQRPRLLLLDEAHAGLDAEAADLVDQVVERVVGSGGTAVVVSHEPDRLAGVVRRTYHLDEGKVTIHREEP